MAAQAMTFYEAGRGLDARVAERNASLQSQQQTRRRGVGTPECPFAKSIDNTRLVKAPDPVRMREMRVFSAAAAALLILIMVYGLQHFYAIESGYRVEAEKQQRDQLREENRQLRLNEAQLTQPGRIDLMAREMGLAEPQPDQIVRPMSRVEASPSALAQMAPLLAP